MAVSRQALEWESAHRSEKPKAMPLARSAQVASAAEREVRAGEIGRPADPWAKVRRPSPADIGCRIGAVIDRGGRRGMIADVGRACSRTVG